VADDAFAVGLFRDVGQIIFARVLGQFYDSVIERALLRGEPLCKTEREMIGSTHAEAGAYLLGLWGMPDTVVNAVAHHHSRSISGGDEFSALSILRIADAIGHQNICKTKS
jgi:HD-like signal output (HDOD) protein